MSSAPLESGEFLRVLSAESWNYRLDVGWADREKVLMW